MRGLRTAVPLLALVLIFVPAGCKRNPKAREAERVPETPLLSVVSVADPAGTVQLASGVFELEANSWRWAARQFTVVLRPPDGASVNGARLELHLNVPAVVVDSTGPLTLSAEIAGHMLAPETYTKPGDYVYTRDVDAALMKGAAVTIHFSTDKALPPKAPETRELALIVTQIGLISK